MNEFSKKIKIIWEIPDFKVMLIFFVFFFFVYFLSHGSKMFFTNSKDAHIVLFTLKY